MIKNIKSDRCGTNGVNVMINYFGYFCTFLAIKRAFFIKSNARYDEFLIQNCSIVSHTLGDFSSFRKIILAFSLNLWSTCNFDCTKTPCF
jgi:hypothetical protein